MTCRHCGVRRRRKSVDWCATCIYEVCCRNYPKLIRTPVGARLVDCKHGDRLRRAFERDG